MTSNHPSWAEIVSKVEHGVVQVITSSGSGSGFVVSDAGHVITNAHVVADANNRVRYGDTVTVRFPGKVDVDGVILDTGIPDNVDLACLQVVGSPLRVSLSLGNFDSVLRGEPVIAVGYPVPDAIDDALTVTQGIVSTKHHGPPQMLLTDADINPGNSGGPLIDRRGNVIGVNTKSLIKAPGGKPVTGINFAIAANAVKLQFPFITRAVHSPSASEPETPAPAPPKTPPGTARQHIIFGERFSINLRPPWELSPSSTPNFARFESDVSSLFLSLVDTGDNLPTFASRNRESLQVRATTWASGEVGKLGQPQGKQSFHFDYQGEYRDGNGVFKGRYDFSSLACGGQRYILFARLVTWENSPDDKAGLKLLLDIFLSSLKPT